MHFILPPTLNTTTMRWDVTDRLTLSSNEHNTLLQMTDYLTSGRRRGVPSYDGATRASKDATALHESRVNEPPEHLDI